METLPGVATAAAGGRKTSGRAPSTTTRVGPCGGAGRGALADPRPPLLSSSLWHSPELLSDIQDGYSVSGHLLVCFSSGYFIHDSLDIIFNHQSRSSWEYLVHHAMAISAFVSLIITGRFLVAAMLLLLVEVSNIFLTVRMLLKMSNVPSPALYEANKYINLVMYFAFRLAPQAYLTWYFLRYVEVQGQGAFLTANLLLLDAMILMYFSRLLRSDFFPSLHKGSVRRDVDGEKFLID
ncbi:PREDICTED: calfacilitin [Haliaeetus leucocephalus]|uniref:calfacilitin n=1 Tax=Haliaeetus leucocephalus TaxID=52644 RepID=UPI00053CE68E|nr:PREDICTED: calfacilitin [Haliaeetus leucocephalus]